MSATQDRVYGLHEFVAENPDEVSFKVGETVMIVERDDQYGDGWWQGTNEKGETGLFPFSYTTLDRELAFNAKALAMSAGDGTASEGPMMETTQQHLSAGQQQQPHQQTQPGMMTTTMNDLDQALTELQGGRDSNADRASLSGAPEKGIRRSFQSERTADLSVDDHTDGGDGYGAGEDEYQSRANARAALAANAKANAVSQLEKERAEQERMKSQAQRMFEQEEARQREMLLKKEEERKQAAAKGELNLSSKNAAKVAPIAGVDMSDESDSEGSTTGLDTYPTATAATHSPLFGMQDRSTFPGPEPTTPEQQKGHQRGASSSGAPTFTSPFMPSANSFQSASSIPPAAGLSELASPIATPSVQSPKREPTTGHSRIPSGLSPVSEYEAPPYPRSLVVGNDADQTALSRGPAVVTSRHESPAYLKQSPMPSRHENGTLPGLQATNGNPEAASAPSGVPVSFSQTQRGAPEPPIQQIFSTGSATRPPQSPTAPDSASGFGAGSASGSQTAATSLTGGRDTPKSIATSAQPATLAPALTGSPAPSFSGSRTAGPAGDPSDWTVDQVVEWARSKGWDEASVVSKFQEHEISGDVLLEMDINILKEIDISAFGKRFQVANAIKELKGGGGGGTARSASQPQPHHVRVSSPGTPGSGFPYPPSSVHSARTASETHIRRSQDSQPASQANAFPAATTGQAAYPGWGNGGIGLGPPPVQDPYTSMDAPGSVQHVSFDRNTSYNSNNAPTVADTFDSLRSTAPHSREVTATSIATSSVPSTDPQPPGAFSSPGGPRKKTLSELADEALIGRNSSTTAGQSPTTSGFHDTGSTGSPSRKRDSGSNKGGGAGERASFFAGINNRMKRGGAGQNASGASVGGRSGKGASHSDLKNQISLPTSSPTFDNSGDTARRAAALQSIGAGGANGGTGTSSATSSTFNPATMGEGEGPVVARIRPVDLEGWMKKKGERYNSWKPRYLALRGGDLVILRDPAAPKIKGYVSMKGYKVIADENTNPGKYGFKILHETEKPHYFSSDDPILVREWMKALMKATIGRDHSFPVISSYNNATISLVEAQRMNPPPRPPSPLSRARTQKAKVRENTTELTAKDAAVLSSIQAGAGSGHKAG